MNLRQSSPRSACSFLPEITSARARRAFQHRTPLSAPRSKSAGLLGSPWNPAVCMHDLDHAQSVSRLRAALQGQRLTVALTGQAGRTHARKEPILREVAQIGLRCCWEPTLARELVLRRRNRRDSPGRSPGGSAAKAARVGRVVLRVSCCIRFRSRSSKEYPPHGAARAGGSREHRRSCRLRACFS